jgi:two-component sensor histidine kinase
MPKGGPHSERTLILAPRGRDAAVAAKLLQEAGQATLICDDLTRLRVELERGAAFAIVTEEAFANGDLTDLSGWIRAQPPWSDFPFVLLTARGDTPTRNVIAARFQDILGNVTFLERPFHPTTLASIARAALRSRRRQYQARELLERYELLVHEVQHRSKNLLAVIQAIASATWPGDEQRDVFFDRLRALANAQDLLTEGEERGASLKDVVARALQSFSDRVHIEGAELILNPRAAQGFTLIMHELTTNAIKYGALAAAAGTVSVNWSVKDNSGNPTVTFQWRERGGPPVTLPIRKGFGSKLLEHAVAHAGDPPRFEYEPEGFTYELQTTFETLSSPQRH